jgi:hypothetical protein
VLLRRVVRFYMTTRRSISEGSHINLLISLLNDAVSSSTICRIRDDDDDDHWRYSPDRALASLSGFMIVLYYDVGLSAHDRPILDTLIQPSETSSSNYQRLSRRSRETWENQG